VGTGRLVGDIPRAQSGSDVKARLSAERGGQPFLVLQGADGSQAIVVLGPETVSLSIGRSADADLSVYWDGEVSRLHAQLERIAGEAVIVDDGLSSNGTFVNGERIGGRRRLRDGDAIRVGATVILYRCPDLQPAGTANAGVGVSLSQLNDTQRRVLTALCRPYGQSAHLASPASNDEIAKEVHIGLDAVKANLRGLYRLFDVEHLAQNKKRGQLAEQAIAWGLVPLSRS
jgi:pSer/pThr/pTyr-binding forkhead associated (FHA) protein